MPQISDAEWDVMKLVWGAGHVGTNRGYRNEYLMAIEPEEGLRATLEVMEDPSPRNFERYLKVHIDDPSLVTRELVDSVVQGRDFCTLEADTEVLYKVTNYYSAGHDKGLAFDDPALGIKWPVTPGDAVLSEKDRKHPKRADLPACFD